MSKSILIIKFEYGVYLTQYTDHEGLVDYSVQYSQQVTHGLTYAEAAKELGLCVMHSLSCASLIDPEEI